ncbi:MAG TPA: FIST N-terminal domain-containing protein [Anaerolineaceae bacterium]|nr:FIST N-terminal domain-containing protein [Anaerolineaceae bacterium]
MSRGIAWGIGRGLDGREAAREAAQAALDLLGSARPCLALTFVAQEYKISDAQAGLSSLLNNIPVWGFSTVRPLTSEGEQPRSVVVALISGTELRAQVQWYPNYSHDSTETAVELAQSLWNEILHPQGILLVADGFFGDISKVCTALEENKTTVAGCLATGDYHIGKTYQIGGSQSGSGALSALILGGRFRLGVGFGHGWQDIGIQFKISKVRDTWVQSLDKMPAAEAYSGIFGYPVRQWSYPPLTELVRLYPLGVEIFPGSSDLVLRSPLHVESDGSFRMNAAVAEGEVAHLMVGDTDACLKAAREAAKEAMASLGKAAPLFGLVLMDVAWQYLFETRMGQIMSILRMTLGDIPLVGAFTLGQIARPLEEAAPNLYNQQIQIVLFGELGE